MKAAAIQIESILGDVASNLAMAEKLVDDAAGAGAEWIMLPEFFTSGMGFDPSLADAALPPDGAATELLLRLAKRHHAKVGGSFLCRDDDRQVRNAFLLATPDGMAGRHDKDIPSYWENCWYVGGDDDGVMDVDGLKVGAAVCLEFARTRTVHRLRGVDLVVGGSLFWRLPEYLPRMVATRRLQERLETLLQCAVPFARMVGAPVVEAAHCGRLDSRDQLLPLRYRTEIGNDAKIVAPDGTILASRSHRDGPGFAIAEIEAGAVPPAIEPPDRYWTTPQGALMTTFWHAQRLHGRRYYRRHSRAQVTPAQVR